MNKKVLSISGAIVVLILAFVLLNNNSTKNKTDNISNETAEKESMEKEGKYTMEEVAKHNTKDDCWMVIDGDVYDVTDFIASHPGGPSILQGCGKDATELFETRPMGSKTPHSSNARGLKEKYEIGELAE